jgi:Tfp pilus assembly protein PilF
MQLNNFVELQNLRFCNWLSIYISYYLSESESRIAAVNIFLELIMLTVAVGALLFFMSADAGREPLPVAARQEIAEDPFFVPPEMISFAKEKTALITGERAKAEALMKILVDSEESGGLGIEYSTDKTRTIKEAWIERKGNCLTLTMAYVMLAKQLQIVASFAESQGAANWSRAGEIILKEYHLVGVILWSPPNTLVVDFLASARYRIRYGSYFLTKMTDSRAKSLFFTNRAVESLLGGERAEALGYLSKALEADPTSNRAWNIKGVIEKSENKLAEAEKSYKTAIRHNPSDVVAVGNLSQLYKSGGFFEEASRLRSLEGRMRKQDPYFHAFVAQESLEKHDFKNAKKSILKAIKLHSTDSDFYVALSNIEMAQKNFGEAISALRKARQHANPERVEYLDYLMDECRLGMNAR